MTIEELLGDTKPEFMKEFRNRNKSVVNFLARKDTILSLLAYFSDPTKTQQEQFCATELLTAEVPPVLGMAERTVILETKVLLFLRNYSAKRVTPFVSNINVRSFFEHSSPR